MRAQEKLHRAFTLAEVLIATAILSLLVIVLASLVSAVNRAWVSGEQRVSQFQDGRAVLELISRELAQAVISPNLQLVVDPDLGGANQRANSGSIFWQASGPSTTSGNLAEIGYYLSDTYELKRFYVPPTDAGNYKIFTAGTQPSDVAALWVTNVVSNPSLSTTVSSGVLAFWVRCFDSNGDVIPWIPNTAAAAPLRFNSAAHFQPAIRGQSNSFTYTYPPALTIPPTTARANLLPSSVELTLVTLDIRSFSRNPQIPAVPAQNSANDVPTVRDSFNQQLISNNIKTSRTFSTRVILTNSP